MSTASRYLGKSLKHKLIDIIKFRGPLTVADYMKLVLTNPESGFYTNENVFGVKGHFTTNPEISQTFGEILSAWIVQEWRRFGSKKRLKLVEFGPGRGTLMSDILRSIKRLDCNNNSDTQVEVHFIEISNKLKQIQEETLRKDKNINGRQQLSLNWSSHIDALQASDDKDEDVFTAYLAHEYLDALPVYKFVRDPKSGGAWRDLLIDYDAKENLRFCIAKQASLASRYLVPEEFKGNHLEVCPEGALQLEKVAKRLDKSQSGCMLVCDYGFEQLPSEDEEQSATRFSPRDTFRAFKNHEPWPPLSDPGEADVTCDVDFGYLKRHLESKALVFGSVEQAQFLLKCGLEARLKVLLDSCKSEEQRNDLIKGAEMLLHSMGQRYRFLALFPKGSEPFFGIDAAEGSTSSAIDPPAGFSNQ